jgi:hypothetical protein
MTSKLFENNIVQDRFDKKILLGSVLVAVAFTIFVAAAASTTNDKVEEISYEPTTLVDDKPIWNPQRAKTGDAHILALEINPEQNYNEVAPKKLSLDKNPKTIVTENPEFDTKDKTVYKKVASGKLAWLDAAISNAGKNTKVDENALYEFYQYTADGNTDFKIAFKDGSTKFYRLYFMEVP